MWTRAAYLTGFTLAYLFVAVVTARAETPFNASDKVAGPSSAKEHQIVSATTQVRTQ